MRDRRAVRTQEGAGCPVAGDGEDEGIGERSTLTADAFGDACASYLPALYRYFYGHLCHVHDAEDLVATTVTKALASVAGYNPARGSFAAWLFGVGRHTLRDFQRRQRPTLDVTRLNPPPIAPEPPPDARLLDDEAVATLCARVQHLPVGQREAVALYYFGGMTATEAAIILGRSEGAVRLLVHRALTTLRGQYREEALG